MVKQFINKTKQLKSSLAALAALMTLMGVVVMPGLASAAPSSYASCQIYDVPSIVASGNGVTPTVAVTNTSDSSFTTYVSVRESLVSKNGPKGGGAGQEVTVAANQSFEFQGGTLYAEPGYKIKIVARSTTDPKFHCKATAKVD